MVTRAKPLLPADVEAALARGEFIEAIKLLRQSTGAGLHEAKTMIDRHRHRVAARPGSVAVSAERDPGPDADRQVAPGSTSSQPKPQPYKARRQPASGEPDPARDRLLPRHLSPGQVPPAGGRVWLAVIAIGLVYLAWRLLRVAE